MRCTRKSKTTGEVEVAAVREVINQQSFSGVLTRAKALALERLQLSASESCYLELRSRRLRKTPIGLDSRRRKPKPSLKASNPSLGPTTMVAVIAENENNVNAAMEAENLPECESRESRIHNSSPRRITIDEMLGLFGDEDEKEQQRRFIEKYNFDPVNDKPLPGRYEWVKVNP